MVSRVISSLSNWWIFVVCLVGVVLYGYLSLLPASWWLTVNSMSVASPVQSDHSPVIALDRVVHQPFIGEYAVEAKILTDSGEWITACHGEGRRNYAPEMRKTLGYTLAMWAGPSCTLLPPGTYQIWASWIIRPSVGDPRTLIVKSNSFKVVEPTVQ